MKTESGNPLPPKDEYIKLAKKVQEIVDGEEPIGNEDELSLCESCYCMTKTIAGRCGKCKAIKFEEGGMPTEEFRQKLRKSLECDEGELDNIIYTFAAEIGKESLREDMSPARFEYSAQKAKSALQTLITKSVIAKLRTIEAQGHGGGNWRRLVVGCIAELEQSLNRKEGDDPTTRHN